MSVRHILIVDDSRTEQAYLTDLLTRAGYAVRTASGGEEALRLLDEALPDLVLMDVVMPGSNGFSLTRQITREPRYGGVPVMLCTSKNQSSDRLWGLRQGACDYLVKPVNGPELLHKIAALPPRQP